MRFRHPLRRSWLRLSIRTLLVAVTLLCVWLAYAAHRARLQEDLVRRINANGGGAFGYHHEMDEAGQHIPDAEPPGPLWLRRLIGDHAFLRIRYVGTYKVREEEMQLISEFPSIEELSLDESVRDEWLKHLAPLRNLKTLTLESAHISDHGIEHLAGLRKLEFLNLTHARVTDEGLKHLANLRNLKELILDYTQVTADGADWLRQHLSQVKVLAAGFASAPDEREAVRQLIKSGGHFSADKDGCISEVMFFGTDVDDDDLRPLESLKRLQSLQLVNTRVTFAGVNRILQANPKLTVSPRFRQPLPEEADAVAALNRIGARLYFDPQGHVKQVDSFDEGLSEDALQPLTQLHQLKTVISYSRHIGHEGCRQLAKIGSLETLWLDYSSLNDADLEQLARLSRLKSLSIAGPDISDDGLANLGRLPSLGKLRFRRSRGDRSWTVAFEELDGPARNVRVIVEFRRRWSCVSFRSHETPQVMASHHHSLR